MPSQNPGPLSICTTIPTEVNHSSVGNGPKDLELRGVEKEGCVRIFEQHWDGMFEAKSHNFSGETHRAISSVETRGIKRTLKRLRMPEDILLRAQRRAFIAWRASAR